MIVQQRAETIDLVDDVVLKILTAALMRKLSAAGVPATGIDEKTSLLDVGVIDSQAILDLILEVEEGCGREFDPVRVDFESGITLGKLSGAFT